MCNNAFGQNEAVGAAELLINPYSKSGALSGANVAYGNGLDAIYTNIAGLNSVEEMAAGYNYGRLSYGLYVHNLGFAQRLSDKGVLSVSGTVLDFGTIYIDAMSPPENPTVNHMHLNVGYAHEILPSLYAGANVKYVSNAIFDLRGTSFAFDAGLQYKTGDQEQFKFGLAISNVGPNLKFGPRTNWIIMNSNKDSLISTTFQLPSTMSFGGSYDLNMAREKRLTFSLAAELSSRLNNNYKLGIHYKKSYKRLNLEAMLGYNYSNGSPGDIYQPTLFGRSNGLSGGASLEIVFGKTTVGLQYAFQTSYPWLADFHTIGLTFKRE